MGAFPSVDLTGFDLGPSIRTARRVTTASVDMAREATYVAVGLGLLTFQRAQVKRRELERGARG